MAERRGAGLGQGHFGETFSNLPRYEHRSLFFEIPKALNFELPK